jgi:hypothetical protein
MLKVLYLMQEFTFKLIEDLISTSEGMDKLKSSYLC